MKYLELSYLVVDNEVFTDRENAGKQVDEIAQPWKDKILLAEEDLMIGLKQEVSPDVLKILLRRETATLRVQMAKEISDFETENNQKMNASHESKRKICYQVIDDSNTTHVVKGYVDEKGNTMDVPTGNVEMTPTTGEYLNNI